MAEAVPAELLTESRELSRLFLMDPRSYGGFSLTRDLRHIGGCVEARDPVHHMHGEQMIVKQTPGGAIGEGQDQSLTVRVVDDEEITLEEAMKRNAVLLPSTVYDAHEDCALYRGIKAVTSRMARPDDFTKYGVYELAEYFNEREHVDATMHLVMDAARVQLELLDKTADQDLLEVADSLYPYHHNVYPVRPLKLARTYAWNLHPFVGKNRNMKPADKAELIQAYHDSIAANAYDLSTAKGLNKYERGIRLTSMLMRTSATRAEIAIPVMDEMVFLDVKPADTLSGLEIIERHY